MVWNGQYVAVRAWAGIQTTPIFDNIVQFNKNKKLKIAVGLVQLDIKKRKNLK